jgi:chromosome segregation protein
MANIGELRTKISLDSAEFQRSMASVNRELRGLKYEQRAVTSTGTGFARGLTEMRAKADVLNRTLDLQKTLQQNEEQNREKLHELQLENAEHNERLKNHQEKVNSLTESLELDQEKLIDIEEKLRQIEQIEQQMENVTQIEEHITELRNEREQTSQQIVELQKERKDKLQIIEDEERELKSQQKLLDQEQKNIQEKEIEANRLDVMLENRLQTLQKQYTMTYEKASAQYEKVTNVTEVRTEVNHLKNEIKVLGTVNLGAIDEYERLSERAAFLNEQRDDLIAAKETLYKAIKQMDEEMISRFKETFHLIQENFAIVFKQLFGGGYAELVLTDPEDYLETGIDIIARPPGKKLKTLELLSGGERALTAIALLFAILRSRPVPFVILDEVDAALDEANVERFASYLKSFSKESQFVVISHRKGTMEEADALYGVTMQESGVSRFVSVRLEEADKLVKSS